MVSLVTMSVIGGVIWVADTDSNCIELIRYGYRRSYRHR